MIIIIIYIYYIVLCIQITYAKRGVVFSALGRGCGAIAVGAPRNQRHGGRSAERWRHGGGLILLMVEDG